MFVQVKLLKGYQQPLWYSVPTEFHNQIQLNSIVQVPLRNKIIPAFVIKMASTKPDLGFNIKPLCNLEAFPSDKNYEKFIVQISHLYFLDPIFFYQRLKSFLNAKKSEVELDPIDNCVYNTTNEVILSKAQQEIVDVIFLDIKVNKFAPCLLHGVTGSGKTEIYKSLIEKTIAEGKSAILLLPEVSLSLQFERLLKNSLKHIPQFSFHSATKPKKKQLLWNQINKDIPSLIIGVHLPILLPIKNLGLIIVDEEHEVGFGEKKHPRLNSKEVALIRAKEYSIPILLGSATPSIQSLYNVSQKGWKFFSLLERFSGKFPKIESVFLNKKEKRKSFWITKTLENEIKNCLDRKEQTLIYINRRGFSFFVKCKECAFVFECPNCSVSLTPHSYKKNDDYLLTCHYCAFSKKLPNQCPECKSSKESLLTKGVGTQQIVEILQDLFPHASIERADLDTTLKKRNWQETVKKFEAGEIDILVGTQTITKGYHFPKVTLVGVIWADLNLHFPVYNASETTLQKLIQVAGRAGRAINESKVIIQAMNPHPIFNYLNEVDYANFYKNEIEFRLEANYPPFCRFIQIELKNSNAHILDIEASEIFKLLNIYAQNVEQTPTILGPIKPIVYKIQKMESRTIYIKSKNFNTAFQLLTKLKQHSFKSEIYIVPTS